VFGLEYFFGGGIQTMKPGTTPYGSPVDQIELGETTKSKTEFDSFVNTYYKILRCKI
jgi:hypothetical protein